MLKGTKAQAITAKESDTDCRVRYVPGANLVVFLAPDGFTVGAHDGVLRECVSLLRRSPRNVPQHDWPVLR